MKPGSIVAPSRSTTSASTPAAADVGVIVNGGDAPIGDGHRFSDGSYTVAGDYDGIGVRGIRHDGLAPGNTLSPSALSLSWQAPVARNGSASCATYLTG